MWSFVVDVLGGLGGQKTVSMQTARPMNLFNESPSPSVVRRDKRTMCQKTSVEQKVSRKKLEEVSE